MVEMILLDADSFTALVFLDTSFSYVSVCVCE